MLRYVPIIHHTFQWVEGKFLSEKQNNEKKNSSTMKKITLENNFLHVKSVRAAVYL